MDYTDKNFVEIQLFPNGKQCLELDGIRWRGEDWWLNHGHQTVDNVYETELHDCFDDEDGCGTTGLVVAISFYTLEPETERFLKALNVHPDKISQIKQLSVH